MDEEYFKKMFKETVETIEKNDLSQEALQERVKAFSAEDGSLDLYNLAGYLANESRLYSKYLVFDVLNNLRKDGYLNLPDESKEVE